LVRKTCNLYVRHEGVTSLIAVVSGADYLDWAGNSAGIERLREMTARVSPDGRWFAFMSRRSITGYDNRDAVSGQPDQEVYLYHAPEDLASQSGALVCASCNPTGARPHGIRKQPEGIDEENLPLADTKSWQSGTWFAANVPGWTETSEDKALYQSRYLSDSGRLFFDADDGLVAKDVNGTGDVYEFEPVGVGGCTEGTLSGSSVYVRASNGCVGLISSGTSARESAFLDASESGGDVFFLTSARLASQDVDTELDVYDAHECTASSPCPAAAATSPPACDTEASCKAASAPQPVIFGAPASATFSGAGNLALQPPPPTQGTAKKAVKCTSGKSRNKHGKCVRRKSAKKAKRAKRSAGRAGNDRRAGR
jgi:hypothetical protein